MGGVQLKPRHHKSPSESTQHDAGIGVAAGPSALGLSVLPTPISIRSSL